MMQARKRTVQVNGLTAVRKQGPVQAKRRRSAIAVVGAHLGIRRKEGDWEARYGQRMCTVVIP